jgi:hypothetical protein
MILLSSLLALILEQSVFVQHSHSTTWRTRSGGMEVGKSQSIVGQFVKIRCPDLAAKAAQVTESQVIGHNDKEVGPFGRIVRFIGRLGARHDCLLWVSRLR